MGGESGEPEGMSCCDFMRNTFAENECEVHLSVLTLPAEEIRLEKPCQMVTIFLSALVRWPTCVR
jgi:hypothetical protein